MSVRVFATGGINQQVCLQYAKEHNISVSFSGPGGYSDVDSCTKYCIEHKDDATCKQYAGSFGDQGQQLQDQQNQTQTPFP